AHVAQERGLADAWRADDHEALAGLEGAPEGLGYAADEPADADGDADDLVVPVAHGAEAVEGAVDAGAVVRPEALDAVDDVVEVIARDELVVRAVVLAGLRLQGAAEVDGDLLD